MYNRSMSERTQKLQQMHSSLWRAESYLRNGQVIYAYRQICNFRCLLTEDADKVSVCNRIVGRLRNGEQLDAHDEIKSLLDRIRNEIRKIEKADEEIQQVKSGQDPKSAQ
jgi:hypothetical protein